MYIHICKIYENRIDFCTNDGVVGAPNPIPPTPYLSSIALVIARVHHIVLVLISDENVYCNLGHR